jgi:hypothetical protein
MENNDKLIEFLQERCAELWKENEGLKFQNFLNIKNPIFNESDENRLELIEDGYYVIYSRAQSIGQVTIDDNNIENSYLAFDTKMEISIKELKNIIQLIENGKE